MDDTAFQILMDVRFDLPPGNNKVTDSVSCICLAGISSNEKDALDGKLHQLNRILEREV